MVGIDALVAHPARVEEALFASAPVGLTLLLLLQIGTSEDVQTFLQGSHFSHIGDYDACRAIPGMEFCLSSIVAGISPNGGMGSPALGDFGLCLPQACDISLLDIHLGEMGSVQLG